jgi:hypothetical protein
MGIIKRFRTRQQQKKFKKNLVNRGLSKGNSSFLIEESKTMSDKEFNKNLRILESYYPQKVPKKSRLR